LSSRYLYYLILFFNIGHYAKKTRYETLDDVLSQDIYSPTTPIEKRIKPPIPHNEQTILAQPFIV